MSFFEPGPLRVKICGVTDPADAAMAIEAGADALGFNFYPGSKRYLSLAENRGWISDLAGQVDRVAVVVNAGPAELSALREAGCFEAIQFHGDENPSACAAAGFPRWMRAVRVKDAASAAQIADYATPHILLDAWSAAGYGGTGERLSWDVARGIVLGFPDRRILLAGGLTPDNVATAVRIARPFGVDVAGGVESAPGRKDPARTRDFLRAAKEA